MEINKGNFRVISFILAVLMFIICIQPLNPSAHRKVKSMEELQNSLKGAVPFALPDMSLLNLTNMEYELKLDGMQLLAKPSGYCISGSFTLQDVPCSFSFHGLSDLFIQEEEFTRLESSVSSSFFYEGGFYVISIGSQSTSIPVPHETILLVRSLQTSVTLVS